MGVDDDVVVGLWVNVCVTLGVVVIVGVRVILGVEVIVGVRVVLGVAVIVGVWVMLDVAVVVGVSVMVAVFDTVGVMVTVEVLEGVRVIVPVRVLVGVGVTQYAVEETICAPLESFTRTAMFPYRPLIESCMVLPVPGAAVNWNGPLVRKMLFW